MTIVTSDGGEAITLATSAGADVTSFAGHEFTIAASNAAVSLTQYSVGPIVASMATLVAGAVVGAFLTL